ncbi:hypothetical protein BFJ68_g16775 [Fusarium oxysporum]|uniref:Uncharacterized protein n=1 Tax=Fusarium oxysporum TaxID=5507 RepID=A0A420P9G3_FUSOX|nr:hypothetical protein BFJ68_g16775 [Fusarium oxysporum]
MTKLGAATDFEDYVFSVSGARYIALRSRTDFVFPNPNSIALVTVFQLPQGDKAQVTAQWLKESVELYQNDDVFHNSFLANIVFHGTESDALDITDEATEYLREIGNKSTACSILAGFLPGPYAYINQQLREAWKLVDDYNGTCMVTLKPPASSSDAFESFSLRSSDDQFSCFAIPSRIPSHAMADSSLAGLRIVIKDNIHLKGIKTSVGNRAFYNTYPPCDTSAECIQKLIDSGVVISGKTKMNSFGNWEEPTEYTDYQAPWNPRADRYQSTGGSSSGSASAVASYDWLDIAIGTDTWGSVTRPALWCGCFGLRPSTGAVSCNGVEPYVKKWDIPGILGRDLDKCRDFAAEWLSLDRFEQTPKEFSSIIWPTDFWGIMDQREVEMAKKFAQLIETELAVPLESLSFEEIWTDAPPPDANGKSMSDFVHPATAALAYDVYHNCDEFRAKHWEKFNQAPYTTIPNERLWAIGKTISKGERDVGFAKIEVYRKWFANSILTGKHANALAILPLETMAPRYRDEPPKFKRPPQDGINALCLAPVLHSPVLAFPIGEIPYHSRVTEREEKLPFAVAVMGVPGTDLTLMDTVRKVLKKAGLPTSVMTGKTMWDQPATFGALGSSALADGNSK